VNSKHQWFPREQKPEDPRQKPRYQSRSERYRQDLYLRILGHKSFSNQQSNYNSHHPKDYNAYHPHPPILSQYQENDDHILHRDTQESNNQEHLLQDMDLSRLQKLARGVLEDHLFWHGLKKTG
jgi:hypothetical protein